MPIAIVRKTHQVSGTWIRLKIIERTTIADIPNPTVMKFFSRVNANPKENDTNISQMSGAKNSIMKNIFQKYYKSPTNQCSDLSDANIRAI
jgi:hypothetical protein